VTTKQPSKRSSGGGLPPRQEEMLGTGVPKLDNLLNGGVPVHSLNVVSGGPGTGKSILCQQIAFHNASPSGKVLYLSTLSEPLEKLVHYQQRFTYFDERKMTNSVIYGDIGRTILHEGVSKTIEAILARVKEAENVRILIVDSFKALCEVAGTAAEARILAYNMAIQLAEVPCTIFLIGEYSKRQMEEEPIFAIADGIFELTNEVKGMRSVRCLRILKQRGGGYSSGLHSFDIDSAGIKLYPRLEAAGAPPESSNDRERVKTDIEGVDEMLQRGIPGESATLVAGGAGTGKTLLGLHFVTQGIAQGEPAVVATFQETPDQLCRIAGGFGWDLKEMQHGGTLRLLYTRPVELDIDRFAAELQDAVAETGARRVVIDSVLDLEAAASSEGRYKEYVYSLVSSLKNRGITSLMTSETPDLFGSVRLTDSGVSVVADNVILLRYVEMGSRLTRAISVLKMRGSDHDKHMREFEITGDGMRILDAFEGVQGVMSGTPTMYDQDSEFGKLLQKMS